MRITRKRCKHCGDEYSFQLSGNGDYTYNDEHYCHDCKKTMLDALENIPKKFIYGWKEIPFHITERMKEVKEKTLSYWEECKINNKPLMRKVYSAWFNPKIHKTEHFVIDNIKYLIQYFYDGEKKMFVWCEKDISTDEYDVNTSFHKETFEISSQNLPEPSGKIFFIQPCE